MKDPKKITDNTKATEQEIRRGRKFNLTEAIGREAAGALKGASPVAPTDQLLMDIENLLELGLFDHDGSLIRVIMARLKTNPALLDRHHSDAPSALKEFFAGILSATPSVDNLVRQADARWGRDFQERPMFNSPERSPHPDDPYTRESVQNQIEEFLRNLD